MDKRAEIAALTRTIDWQITCKLGTIKTLPEGAEKTAGKASVRTLVEHLFHILKNLFHHRKTGCRGLVKNGHQLYTLFGLANMVNRCPSDRSVKRLTDRMRRSKKGQLDRPRSNRITTLNRRPDLGATADAFPSFKI